MSQIYDKQAHQCPCTHAPSEHTPCTTELVSGAEPARAELPLLAPREELILEERVSLARVRTEHEPQPEKVPVDPAPGRGLAGELRMHLECAPQQCEAGVDLYSRGARLCQHRQGRRRISARTEMDGLAIERTHARASAVRVRIVSVRPCLKSRVSAVSYVAVNEPRVRYHAS